MRIVILAALSLLPLAAHSQATAVSSPTLQAGLTPPAHIVRVSANDTTPTPIPTPKVSIAHTGAVLHDHVTASLVAPQMQHADSSLSYTLLGDATSASSTPSLVHVVGRLLPAIDKDHTDADVTVTLTVDLKGNPENIRITKSAGAALDASTVAAVSQYRFKPAIIGNQPVESDMAVEVKLSK